MGKGTLLGEAELVLRAVADLLIQGQESGLAVTGTGADKQALLQIRHELRRCLIQSDVVVVSAGVSVEPIGPQLQGSAVGPGVCGHYVELNPNRAGGSIAGRRSGRSERGGQAC